MVIAEVMGAPLEDAPRLHHWSNWIQRQFDPTSLMTERAADRAGRRRVLRVRGRADRGAARTDPGDDLISALIAAEEAGDRLSNDELRNLILNILVGGVDTSQSQLAHAVRLLASHPDQWQALRADPRRAGVAAVEEALRYEPITPFTARILTAEVEYRGVTFPPGSIVLVSAWHANRDGVDPDRFDITAERDGAALLTFGAGIHYCVGANLARAEMQEALAFLAGGWLIALDGEPEFGTPSGIYGFETLPLRWRSPERPRRLPGRAATARRRRARGAPRGPRRRAPAAPPRRRARSSRVVAARHQRGDLLGRQPALEALEQLADVSGGACARASGRGWRPARRRPRPAGSRRPPGGVRRRSRTQRRRGVADRTVAVTGLAL